MSELAPLYRVILYAALVLVTLIVLDWFASRPSQGVGPARPRARRAPPGPRRASERPEPAPARYRERHAR